MVLIRQRLPISSQKAGGNETPPAGVLQSSAQQQWTVGGCCVASGRGHIWLCWYLLTAVSAAPSGEGAERAGTTQVSCGTLANSGEPALDQAGT